MYGLYECWQWQQFPFRLKDVDSIQICRFLKKNWKYKLRKIILQNFRFRLKITIWSKIWFRIENSGTFFRTFLNWLFLFEMLHFYDFRSKMNLFRGFFGGPKFRISGLDGVFLFWFYMSQYWTLTLVFDWLLPIRTHFVIFGILNQPNRKWSVSF